MPGIAKHPNRRIGQTPRASPQSAPIQEQTTQSKRALASLIFLSRWLQAPLYLGLIVAQVVYVYRFMLELRDLIGFVLLDHASQTS